MKEEKMKTKIYLRVESPAFAEHQVEGDETHESVIVITSAVEDLPTAIRNAAKDLGERSARLVEHLYSV